MNKTEEVIEKVDLTVEELNKLIKIQSDYSYLVGCEFGFEMSKNFINMYYQEDGINKIKEILEFQIKAINAMKNIHYSQKKYDK